MQGVENCQASWEAVCGGCEELGLWSQAGLYESLVALFYR